MGSKNSKTMPAAKSGPVATKKLRGRPAKVGLPSKRQIGGDHYKGFAIQPAEFIHRNGIGFLPGCVIKRVLRYRMKDGIQDLRKAIHEIELMIELEETDERF